MKKSGELRMCVDYRGLNAKTIKDAYPLPRIEESLDALNGAAVFSTMDLQSAYYQVEIAEEDRAKTALTTPVGLFEFKRLAFGLCNAPATYQRLMKKPVSRHIPRSSCVLGCHSSVLQVGGRTYRAFGDGLQEATGTETEA